MADAPGASDARRRARTRLVWHDARIVEMIDETPDVKLIRFRFEGSENGTVPFDFAAGQWVALRTSTDGGRPVTRAYSIASPPQEKRFLELCIKEVPGGKLTPFLFKMKPGDPVKVRSPQGRFVLHEDLPGNLVFVATGTGIAPFWSMVNDLLARGTGRKMMLFFGARYEEDVIYREGFQRLATDNPGFQPIITLSRPRTDQWSGERGYVQVQMRKYVDDPMQSHVYICGLRNMIDAVVETAKDMGFEEDRIFFESYD